MPPNTGTDAPHTPLRPAIGVTGTRAEYQSLGQPPWAPPSWLFGPVSRVAAGLLLPYWAWVSFATALNAWIWANN